jgi:hypothetical protein
MMEAGHLGLSSRVPLLFFTLWWKAPLRPEVKSVTVSIVRERYGKEELT